jgi:hypothetical protein
MHSGARADARLQDRSASILSHAERTGRETAVASGWTGSFRGTALSAEQERRSRQQDADHGPESSASGPICGGSHRRTGLVGRRTGKMLTDDSLDPMEREVSST